MNALGVINSILIILSQFLRIIGMGALGVAFAWLFLDLMRKAANWYMEAILFLGLVGLIIAMTAFLGWGALGAFALGFAIAIFVWGMPKKAKVDND
jgi:hypothetical protein